MKSKFLGHKGFMFGAIIILLAALLGIFAYAFIPDKSKNANEQIPQMALKPPGTSALFYVEKSDLHPGFELQK